MSTSPQKGAMIGLSATGKGVGVYDDTPLANDRIPFVHTFENKSGRLQNNRSLHAYEMFQEII